MKLVFLHGSGGTALVWKHQTEHYPASVAVTLPGHPDGEPCRTIPDAARWLKQLVDREGWRDLVLVGHSLGGGIALQYALDYPEDLKAIVPVGSGARLRVHPDTLKLMEQMVETPDAFADTFVESWQNVAPEFAAELKASAINLGPEPFLTDLLACDRFDVMDRLADIATPTHAIVGTEDVMTPPMYSEYLRDHVPDAGVTIIDGGTHFVFGEFPDLVNDAIDGFLAGLA